MFNSAVSLSSLFFDVILLLFLFSLFCNKISVCGNEISFIFIWFALKLFKLFVSFDFFVDIISFFPKIAFTTPFTLTEFCFLNSFKFLLFLSV